jgi:hypothetical protein
MMKGERELKQELDEEFEWDNNPIKRAIQKMFRSRLNEDSYRKVPIQEAKEYVETTFFTEKVYTGGPSTKKANTILKKVQRASNTTEIVLILGNYLLED